MKIPQMITAEFRRLFSTRMSIIALIALVCVPILYGGLYLWANQDPYGSLDEVPVALVVSDSGATINGTARNLGNEVADELLDSDTFDWHVVSASEAESGLDNGSYDFSIEIPSDFTDAIASITSDSPRQADLDLRTNDANNYLASTIGSQAIQKIQKTVAEKVVNESGLTLLDALNTIRINLLDASDGAGQLADALSTAKDGADSLGTGSSQLADGTVALRDGAATLTDGANQVAAGTATLNDTAQQVAAASTDVTNSLPQARSDIAAELAKTDLDQSQIDQILGYLDDVGDDVVTVNSRVQNAVAQINQLNDGAHQVAAGAATLTDGAASAADGAAQVRDGISSLDNGIVQILDGAGTLRDSLTSGADELPDSDKATRSAQAKTLSSPVEIETSSVTSAQNYGAGLAPFFAALAAWIGIYALFLIVKPTSRRAVTALHSPLRVTLAGWATPAALGAVQMVALFAVLSYTLGFEFTHPWATLGLLVFASATYAAIIMALNVWLGSVGQFLGLVLMVLQLVTAGGTFPWQTLPAPLAALHHVLPMGYVVDAMRQVMYGGNPDRVWVDVSILAAWLVGALILSAIGVTRMTHKRTLRDLQPSLIG
ncbi:putative membrane protein [Microbacterium endophyticum]|nr:YhgE/Pip domain-containing protein [Microbacterium endophyticum]NIK36014.1 putative membrane protein [Microbacterium endophyticum]